MRSSDRCEHVFCYECAKEVVLIRVCAGGVHILMLSTYHCVTGGAGTPGNCGFVFRGHHLGDLGADC